MGLSKWSSGLFAVLLCSWAAAQKPITTLHLQPNSFTTTHDLGSTLKANWSFEAKISGAELIKPQPLIGLTGENSRKILDGRVAGEGSAARIEFLLFTRYRKEPLSVEIPVQSIRSTKEVKLLLTYQSFHFKLFCNGSLVDEEWPIGELGVGAHPRILIERPVVQLSVWSTALADEKIASLYGGLANIDHEAEALLGPQPKLIQFSRPRGFNINAGDAMPFYHDGTFHLFYLLDRRQHHSKRGLGAHQWEHISSTDLMHWRRYPVALPIDHDWEGSICTGSVFFHNGRYYAYYATRMADRSEHLAMAESNDGIHFQKLIPTPFAEPSASFVHGPNRDPFVFRAGCRCGVRSRSGQADARYLARLHPRRSSDRPWASRMAAV